MSRYSGSCRARTELAHERLFCRGLAYTSCELADEQCEWLSLFEEDKRRALNTWIAISWLITTVLVMMCIHHTCITPRRRRQQEPSPMVLIISCLICLFVPCGPLLMWLPFVCDCCWQQQYSQIQYSGAAMTTTVIATQPVMAVQAQPAGQVVYAQAVPAAGVYPASALPSAHAPPLAQAVPVTLP